MKLTFRGSRCGAWAIGLLAIGLGTPSLTVAQVAVPRQKPSTESNAIARPSAPPGNVIGLKPQRTVYAFAISKLGQRLGRGECTDLVEAALKHAGCKPGNFSDAKNYVWGDKISKLPRIGPLGHIIQFEDCSFVSPDGKQRYEMPHHTAIVKSASGTAVELIHQNAPIGGPVVELKLDLSWLKSGRYTIFKPSPLK